MSRARTLAAAAAATLALAACGRDDRVPETDTSRGAGIIDSAPGAALAAVAATLSDENVFALLDTAYTAVMQTDSLGAARASDARVRAFAANAVTANAVNRRGVAATFDRLQVRRNLPDRDVIKDHAQRMNELRGKTGREFDEAYVRRAVEVRRSLIDEIDDALKVDTRTAGVKTYLEQLKGVLQAELQQAEALGRSNG
jgi:putative membrane protein